MNFKLFAAIMVVSSLVAGCGIKGPLYMPQDQSVVTQAPQDPSNTAANSEADQSSTVESNNTADDETAVNDEVMTDADKVNSVLKNDNVGNKVSVTTR